MTPDDRDVALWFADDVRRGEANAEGLFQFLRYVASQIADEHEALRMVCPGYDEEEVQMGLPFRHRPGCDGECTRRFATKRLANARLSAEAS